MEMTLDDLVKIFRKVGREGMSYGEYNHEAGVRAVVLALRDHMYNNALNFSWNAGEIEDAFNDILGDAGNEKATGGHEEEGVGPEYARQRFGTPAAAPSPAVCEWTHEHGPYWLRHCHELGPEILVPDIDLGIEGMPCGMCLKPIKFKEPSHD